MIILDIDDVLLDWAESFDLYLRDIHNYNGERVQFSPLRIPQLLDISFEESNKLMTQHNESEYFRNIKIKNDSNLINQIKCYHYIVGITSCGNSGKIIQNREFNINNTFKDIFDNIIYLNLHEDKYKYLFNYTEMNTDIYYLDDNIKNIEYADSIGINAYVYVTEFNKHLIKDNIKYVLNMEQFLKEIK